MEFLIRLVQVHESFRKSELEALATLFDIRLEFLFYDKEVSLFLISELSSLGRGSLPSTVGSKASKN